MDRIFGEAEVGRKNISFGIALFVLLGVMAGIPLTINFFGGSVLTPAQYQTWKVVHGYGIFLGFINYFFGLMIDRLHLTHGQKQLSSWSFLIAGLFGAITRMTLVLMSALSTYGLYASLGEVVFITIGTIAFVLGQLHSGAPQAQHRPRELAFK